MPLSSIRTASPFRLPLWRWAGTLAAFIVVLSSPVRAITLADFLAQDGETQKRTLKAAFSSVADQVINSLLSPRDQKGKAKSPERRRVEEKRADLVRKVILTHDAEEFVLWVSLANNKNPNDQLEGAIARFIADQIKRREAAAKAAVPGQRRPTR